MKYQKLLSTAFTLLAISISSTLLVGCTQEDNGDSQSDAPESGSGESSEIRSLRTSCGTVFNGEVINPANPGDAKRGSVRVLGANLLGFKTKRGEQLIKLHGVDSPSDPDRVGRAEEVLSELSAEGDAYFFLAEPECVIESQNGNEGAIGHLFSAKGKSFGEQVIRSGAAETSLDACRGSLISSCYRALEEEAAPTPTPYPEFLGPPTAKGFILWKPVSDSDGRLAIHSVPYGTSVRVESEMGRNQGPGNGYGSLARFRKSGCSYGSRVKIQLILSDGTKHMFGKNDYAVVPNGCSRWLIAPNGVAKPDSK